MNWSRIIGNIGRTLIGTGTLILLFVVYQLWGTGLQEARAQDALADEFNAALEEQLGEDADRADLADVALPESLDPTAVQSESAIDNTPEAAVVRVETGDLGTTSVIDLSNLPTEVVNQDVGPPPPPPQAGEGIAQIRIPSIGLTKTIVEGVGVDELKKGPGHYPGTPLPGQAGNSSIAGHRTTYGSPFHNLDELVENDLIYVTTVQGSFVYRVVEQLIVKPKDVFVLNPTEDNRLTLTTCHPRWSARERLVIVAELLGDPAPSDASQLATDGAAIAELADDGQSFATEPGENLEALPEPEAPTPTTVPTSTPDPSQTITEVADGGIGADADAVFPAIFTGLLTAFIGVSIWLASNRWRKWLAYAIGAPLFLIALMFFFDFISRAVAWNL
jgi:sortase A